METTAFGLTDLFYIVGGMLLFGVIIVTVGALYSMAPNILKLVQALQARYLTRAALDSLIERIADLPKPAVVKDNEEKPAQVAAVMSTKPTGTKPAEPVPMTDTKAPVSAEPLNINQAIELITSHNLSKDQLFKLLTLLKNAKGEYLSVNTIHKAVGGNRQDCLDRIEAERTKNTPAPLPTTPIAQRPSNGVFKTQPEPSKV